MYQTKMIITGQDFPSSFNVIFENFNDFSIVRQLKLDIIITPTMELIDLVLTRIAFSGSSASTTPYERLERFAQKALEVEKYFGTTVPVTYLPHIYARVNGGLLEDVPTIIALAEFVRSKRKN